MKTCPEGYKEVFCRYITKNGKRISSGKRFMEKRITEPIFVVKNKIQFG